MKNYHVKTKSYTILACIIGLALIDDLTANEQNALGNFLFLIAQVLETNSAIQQEIEEDLKGYDININSKQTKNGDSLFSSSYIDKEVINNLIKDVNIIKKKLDSLL